MEDFESRRNSCRRSSVLVPILALALGLTGCPRPTNTHPMLPGCYQGQVKLVCIDAQGNADPDPVKVKKKTEIVVWMAPEGSHLVITFPQNPFPQPVSCPGDRYCASLLPPGDDAAEKLYDYTATVTIAETTKTSDPQLEVVKK